MNKIILALDTTNLDEAINVTKIVKDKNFTEKNMKITFKIKRKKDEIKYIYSHS